MSVKKTVQEIADKLGRARSTVWREIKRGTRLRIGYELQIKKQYRADIAQKDYVNKGTHKERSFKIGKDTNFEEYIRDKLLKDRYSPDVIIGTIKRKGLKFKGMLFTKTLYNYIDAGIFSGISNENLWEKRKRRKRRYKKISRVSRTNRMGKSIEERHTEINNRIEYGHWEGDCVKSPLGCTSGLFTLTEIKKLEEIIIKLDQCTQEEIKNALNSLDKKFGSKLKLKFKSITFDNGVKFLNWKSLELSKLNSKSKRTTIYFVQAYSSWERGSNENKNKMIRRFIPKGTDIHTRSDKEINEIQNWMNNYPRKKLGYKSANQMVRQYFQVNKDLNS
ncbi:MAG: IS30 family transposase [Lysobacterales bacterium]